MKARKRKKTQIKEKKVRNTIEMRELEQTGLLSIDFVAFFKEIFKK
jgi:hypothetical protein